MNSRYGIGPLKFDNAATYPLGNRQSKVHVGLFAKPTRAGASIQEWLKGLPQLLAADDLRKLVAAIEAARAAGKPILWGLGGHVIKCGLGPVLIDLMDRGFATGFALNGSAAIHDFEIALAGSTSEDVVAEIGSGRFGLARETGELFNEAASLAHALDIGLGESLGKQISEDARFSMRDQSLLDAAYRRFIPVTVHVALGTDIVHIHPAMSGENTGKATFYDFQLFCGLVAELHAGGVFINVGSAVVLPEVFLKAVSIVRNLGKPLGGFTTANMDFIQHYRPTQNVLKRPTQESGTSIALTGHHEIMVPLLAAALKGNA